MRYLEIDGNGKLVEQDTEQNAHRYLTRRNTRYDSLEELFSTIEDSYETVQWIPNNPQT